MAAGIERHGLFGADCPYVAGWPSTNAEWHSVGFVHWSYDPADVARLLPSHVSVDLYGGKAWAGYQLATITRGRGPRWTLFRIEHHEARAVVAVIDRFGLPGVWYLSVDINRRALAAGYRRWLNLAAYEAESRFSYTDERAEYWTQRPDGTTARLKLTVGREIIPTDVDRFLTARWRLVLPPHRWDPPAQGRWMVTAHEPWTLHRAWVEFFDDEVLVAAGLPPAVGPGQALWSPGTSVQVGWPRRL